MPPQRRQTSFFSEEKNEEDTDTEELEEEEEEEDDEDEDEEDDEEETERSDDQSSSHLRILCLNCFLIPGIVSWNPYFWAPFWCCRRTAKRSEQIGQLCRSYDLICLQEVWGTSMNSINDAVAATHSILPECQSYCKFEWLNEMVDPWSFYLRKTGGLWHSWRRNKLMFTALDRSYFQPIGQVPFSNQNVTFMEFDAGAVFPGKRLLIFNTHFSVFGSAARKTNLETLQSFVSKHIWRLYLEHLSSSSSFSTSLDDVGVMIMGDFNIDKRRSPRSYRRLKTLGGMVTMRDIFTSKENQRFNKQKTYNTQERDIPHKKKGNSLFPWPFNGRVDYIFAVDTFHLSSELLEQLMEKWAPETIMPHLTQPIQIPYIHRKKPLNIDFNTINCKGMDILTQPYGEELSDHWGLSARISLSTVVSSLSALSSTFGRSSSLKSSPSAESLRSSSPPSKMSSYMPSRLSSKSPSRVVSSSFSELAPSRIVSSVGDRSTDRGRQYTLYNQQSRNMMAIPTAVSEAEELLLEYPDLYGVTGTKAKARKLFQGREKEKEKRKHRQKK